MDEQNHIVHCRGLRSKEKEKPELVGFNTRSSSEMLLWNGNGGAGAVRLVFIYLVAMIFFLLAFEIVVLTCGIDFENILALLYVPLLRCIILTRIYKYQRRKDRNALEGRGLLL